MTHPNQAVRLVLQVHSLLQAPMVSNKGYIMEVIEKKMGRLKTIAYVIEVIEKDTK